MNNSTKEDLEKTGIYRITNKVNGKVYYGSTIRSFRKRWKEHTTDLDTNTHWNNHLQNAWNKYGSITFEFSIVLICTSDYECLMYEQACLDLYWDNCEKCYNISPTAGNCLGVKHTAETKRKRSEILRGRVFSDEHRKNLGLAQTGEKNRRNMLGKTHSTTTIDKMSTSHTERWASKAKTLTHDGKTLSVGGWAKITGLSRATINHRIDRGWTAERTLTTPRLDPIKALNEINDKRKRH